MYAQFADNNFPQSGGTSPITPAQVTLFNSLVGKAFLVVEAMGNDPDFYTPAAGQWYATTSGTVNGWAGHDNALAYYDGSAWTFYDAVACQGLIIYPLNVGTIWYTHDGTEWGISTINQFVPPLNGYSWGLPSLPWNIYHGATVPAVPQVVQNATLTINLASAKDTTSVIIVEAQAANCFIELPAASERREFLVIFQDIQPGWVVTIEPQGADTINGAADVTYNDTFTGKHVHVICYADGYWSAA